MKWISIEDESPSKTGIVLCCRSDTKGVSTGLYIKYEDGGGRWAEKVELLTHWMPLPEPPK